MGRLQTVALAEDHLGANSISKLDKLRKQSGFRGTAATARPSENSTKGTPGDSNIVTRNHVALAACRTEKSDVRGRSGFDWIAQLVRLRGSTVLLVMVCMTNGLAGSGEKLTKNVGARQSHQGCELPFVCMGDWSMTPEEMQ